MAIPLKYNLRNLRVRWITALMTVAGIALVTMVFVFMFALGIGMEHTLVATGHPLNMIVLRAGATETQSGVSREQVARVRDLKGIELNAKGEPLISAELVAIANHPHLNGKKANLAIRGVDDRALELRENIKVLPGGRWFRPNLGELVVGKGVAARFAQFNVGDEPFIRGRAWKVVGHFEADGQSYESEVWGHIDDLKAQFKREYSTIIVRCKDAKEIQRLATLVKETKDIKLEGKPHVDYYKDQNQGVMMLKALGVVMALVLSIGAIFGAANTMFAAVASRAREIATMRVLGFSRFAIWLSFIFESALLGLAGGALGTLAGRLVLHGITTGTSNWQTFTEVAFQFRVTPGLMLWGTGLAMVMGVIGGFLPAWRASRATIATALRGL